MSDTQTGTVLTDYSTGNGYACGSCGQWVTHGGGHACYQQGINYCFVPTTFTTIDSQRLAELIEAEKKLQEIRRILDRRIK